MSSEEIVIDVRGLSKRYEIYATPRDRLKQLVLPHLHQFANRAGIALGVSQRNPPPCYYHEFSALNDISFQVRRGETIGIIGRNGSGKSTLLQILAGTLAPTSGEVDVNGRIAALLELGSGFNPEFTGRENVFLNGRILGLTLKEIEARYDQIIEFADIGEFIDQPVKTYSSGMVVRLAFSVAVNINPEILIIDEALAVGDVAFQRKCISCMEEFSRGGGVLLFVSHSIEQIKRLCNRAIYLKKEMGVIGNAKEVCDIYEMDLFGNQVIANEQYSCTVDTFVSPNHNKLTDTEGAPFEFPECAMQYGNRVAQIVQCWTADVHGNKKTVFKTGEKVALCYQVVFDEHCDDVFYGLMVKTKEGINLFGTNSLEIDAPLSNGQPDKTTFVIFELDSHLGPGEYFLNCSVVQGSTTNPVFLHRVIDAAIIKIDADDPHSSGLVDMGITCKMATRTRVIK